MSALGLDRRGSLRTRSPSELEALGTRTHVTHYRHPAQFLALIVGLGYVAIGIVGFFVTGFTNFVHSSNSELFGFGLNGFHNIVHLGVGGILVGASLARPAAITQGVLIGGGLVYLLAAVLGFTNHLGELLTIHGTLAPDNFLHLASGLIAIGAGFLGGDIGKRRIVLLHDGRTAARSDAG